MSLSLDLLGKTLSTPPHRPTETITRRGAIPGRGARRWGWEFALVCLLAAGFTAPLVAWSFGHGRLRMAMTYDDVTYCLHALPLLHGAQEGGLAGLGRAYVAHPPHGPLNSALAGLGFAVFGLADWVPYAMNALLVALFLGGTLYLGRDLGAGTRVAMLGFTLCWPLVGIGVREFRPDFYAALFTVAAVWLAVERASDPGRRRADWLVGVAFGLALLAKPSFFAHTAVMFSAVLGVETILRWRGAGRPGGLMAAGGRRLLAIALVAGPHYAVNYQGIWSYFYGNSFGQNAELWKMHAGWWEKVAYFWIGGGGQTLLGGTLWVLLALVVWGLARRPGERARLLGVLGVGLLSFLVICSGAHRDSPFFALCAYVTLSAAGLRCFGLLWERGWDRAGSYRPGRGLAAGAAVAAGVAMLLAAGGALWRQTKNDPFTAEHIAAVNRINHAVAEALGREIRAAGERGADHQPVRVFATFLGPEINCSTLGWAAAKAGLDVEAFDMQFTAGWPAARDALEGNELIVAARGAEWQVLPWLPAAPTVAQACAALSGNPDCVRLGSWPGLYGSEFTLFKNRAFRGGFEGFTDIEGLRPAEGPYPQWNLHYVRWGTAPRTRLAVEAPADGNYRFLIDLRANTAGRVATFTLDGRPLHRQDFGTRVGFFERLELPVELTRGRHELEIDYNTEDAEAHHTVLYRRLVFAPTLNTPVRAEP